MRGDEIVMGGENAHSTTVSDSAELGAMAAGGVSTAPHIDGVQAGGVRLGDGLARALGLDRPSPTLLPRIFGSLSAYVAEDSKGSSSRESPRRRCVIATRARGMPAPGRSASHLNACSCGTRFDRKLDKDHGTKAFRSFS